MVSDELGTEFWKPSVEPYLRVLELLGVAPARAVYVGDNPAKDFLGARRAGMRSIRWRRRGGLHARAEPVGPESAADWETTTIRGLERLLLSGSSARLATAPSRSRLQGINNLGAATVRERP